MKTTKLSKNFVEIGSGKTVICFEPPATGKLYKSVFTGKCCIVSNSKVVHLTSDQSEELIKNNFEH